MRRFEGRQLNRHQYLGGIHIHSSFSDGTGDIEEISRAAKSAGLDWIIISDHNSLEIEEGMYNGVCVIKGEEISPPNENHYLALGINNFVSPTTPANFVEDVRTQGGFGFAAHPFEGINAKGNLRNNSYPPIRWQDKSIAPDGVEIWNWFSAWGDSVDSSNIFTLAFAYLFRNSLVNEPSAEALTWWDELNNEKENIVPAIGGIDAHALKITDYLFPVTVFPYKKMLRTITNVISLKEPLARDFETKKNQILSAIRSGNNLIVNRAVCNNVPEIYVLAQNKCVLSGERAKLSEELSLCVNVGKKSLIKVFCDGIEIKNIVSSSLKLLLDKVGKYRVGITINGKGFAYSNPILVS